MLSALNREPTTDISPETVGTLSLIMLAQAQEVIFHKATAGTQRRTRASSQPHSLHSLLLILRLSSAVQTE